MLKIRLKTIKQVIEEYGFYSLNDEYFEYWTRYNGFEWHINRFMVVNFGNEIYLKKLDTYNPNYTHVHFDGIAMFYHEEWFE